MESQGPFGTIVDSFYSSRIGFLGPEILPGEFVLAPGMFLYDFCNLFNFVNFFRKKTNLTAKYSEIVKKHARWQTNSASQISGPRKSILVL